MGSLVHVLAEMPENPIGVSPPVAATSSASTPATSVFASVFACSAISQPSQTPSSSFSNQICVLARSDCPSASSSIEPTSLSLSPSLYLSNNGCSLFSKSDQDHIRYAPSPQPAMSATALLQKAAQIGATSSNPSFLRGLGLAVPSSSSSVTQDANVMVKQEINNTAAAAGLGLGLSSGLTHDVMMDPSSLFGNKPTTLDLLGLGIGAGGASSIGLSALLSSFTGDLNVGPPTTTYGEGSGNPPEKP